MKSKTVGSIMRHVASKLPPSTISESAEGEPSEEAALEGLYEKIAWPLGRIYGHAYDAFKLMLSYVESFLFSLEWTSIVFSSQ